MSKPEMRLSYCLNGHTLDGVRVRGSWTWTCSFREVERLYNGDTTPASARAAFEKLAMAGVEGKRA